MKAHDSMNYDETFHPIMSHDTEFRIQNALCSILAENPSGRVGIKELCGRAGVGRATFYRHYASAEDVVDGIYRSMMGRVGESARLFADMDWRGIDGYMRSMYSIMRDMGDMLLPLHRAGMTPRLARILRERFRPEDAPDTERMYAIEYHIGGIVSFLSLWLDRAMRESPYELAEMAENMRLPIGRPVLMDADNESSTMDRTDGTPDKRTNGRL